MKVVQRLTDWYELRKSLVGDNESRLGFVPTMGYLHEGHLSLVKRAREENDLVVLSIFVNPLQFGENEDFDDYPRNLQRDCELAQKHGVDVVFAPSTKEMYPTRPLTNVSVQQVTERLCGRSRPGHFDGVCTVVMKLFQIIQPDVAYFGQKDAQQVAVIKQMVNDLNIPVNIQPCPIVREKDGLALSSRNVNLSVEERKQARILYECLMWAQNEIKAGKRKAYEIQQEIKAKIAAQPLAQIDYVEIRTYPTLEEIKPSAALEGNIIIALAVYYGQTRLIDNVIMDI